MSQMSEIEIELQEAEETIQRGINIIDYLEQKILNLDAQVSTLLTANSKLQDRVNQQVAIIEAMKKILQEYEMV